MKITKQFRSNLSLETLEDRANPSSFVNTQGDLIINGTAGADNIRVYEQPGWVRVVDNGVTSWYTRSRIWGNDIFVYGGNGNDYVNNYANSLRLNAFGQHGNDTLIGGENHDHLHGGEGNDLLMGYGGNDWLEGRVGADRLYGMAGNDTLDGGVGDGAADYLNGGTGFDWFRRDPYRFLFLTLNRDNPVDFNSAFDHLYT